MRIQIRALLLLCCLGALPEGQAVELKAGVLLDSSSGTIFLMRPNSGVESVDIASGQTNWLSTAGDRPLAVEHSRLLAQVDTAQAGRLTLAFLDTADGSAIDQRELSLPGQVVSQVDDGLRTRFRLSVPPGSPATALRWDFRQHLPQGMPTDARPQNLAGLINVNVQSGTAAPSALPAPPLVLRSDIEVEVIPGLFGRQFLSQTREYVLESNPLPIDRSGSKNYHWKIYSKAGSLVGETETLVSYAPFEVFGPYLLFVTPEHARQVGDDMLEQPLTLNAHDLRDGTIHWQRVVRDTRYRGPYPL